VNIISGAAFGLLARNKKNQVGRFTLRELGQVLRAATATLETKEPEAKEEVIQKHVPKEYYDFLLLFKKALAKGLLPYRPYDYKIPLKEGFTPSFRPIYFLSKVELKVL
jgi:hypothetical protein